MNLVHINQYHNCAVHNTNIDYPILKSTDNKYYLDHNIEKKHSPAGSLFMDYRNNNT